MFMASCVTIICNSFSGATREDLRGVNGVKIILSSQYWPCLLCHELITCIHTYSVSPCDLQACIICLSTVSTKWMGNNGHG